MVARLNSHESNLINRMDKHAKAVINTHVPGFLDCSRVVPVITMHTEDILLAVAWRVELQRMPEGTESRSQHGRPGPNGSPCSNEKV